MAVRRRTSRKAAHQTKPGVAFRAVAEGLYELKLGGRVALDLLVTLDGELMTFVRIDGELFAELPVAGQA